MRQPISWFEPIRTVLKRGRSAPHAAAGFVAVVLIAVLAADAIGPRPHPDPDSSGPAPTGAPTSTPGAQPSAGSWVKT